MAPARAATGRIMLDVVTSRPWSIDVSRAFIGRFTASRLAYGACEPRRVCIRVRERSGLFPDAARTVYGQPGGGATVYVDPAWWELGWYTKERIMVHELAHALGVRWHDQRCADGVMYGKTKCPDGTLPPLRFSQAERDVLARH